MYAAFGWPNPTPSFNNYFPNNFFEANHSYFRGEFSYFRRPRIEWKIQYQFPAEVLVSGATMPEEVIYQNDDSLEEMAMAITIGHSLD
jgi:hypothetical protein